MVGLEFDSLAGSNVVIRYAATSGSDPVRRDLVIHELLP